MEELVLAVLRLGSPQLASEEAACGALRAIRWGTRAVRCPRCDVVADDIDCARFRCCWCESTFTVLVGTPLARLRRPRVRALLLALRAMAATARGISARELARDVGMPPATLWRHLHALRELLPISTSLAPSARAAAVDICGRHQRTRRRPARGRYQAEPASLIAAATSCLATCRSPARKGGAAERLLGESFHAWVVGTFHGVTARWLDRYVREQRARAWQSPAVVVDVVIAALAQAP